MLAALVAVTESIVTPEAGIGAGAGALLVAAANALIQRSSVKVIRSELQPNGGHSIKDQVNEIASEVHVLTEKVNLRHDALIEKIDALAAKSDESDASLGRSIDRLRNELAGLRDGRAT